MAFSRFCRQSIPLARRVLAAACAVAPLLLAAPVAAQTAVGVEQLWVNNCLRCHGQNGQGGGAGTSTLLSDDLMDQSHDLRFYQVIKRGLPESGMEAFGETLEDAQVWALVGYIRELQHRDWRKRVGSTRADATGTVRTQRHAFRIERVVEHGLRIPWSVEFLPDGRMLIADRPGQLRVHSTGKPGGVLSAPVEGTPQVRHRGQGGLMDVAVHPRHAENGWIYLAYSHPRQLDGREVSMTRIVRGKLRESQGRLAWVDQQIIFDARPEHDLPGDLHFGCRIVFDPKDPSILFFSIGDRGRMEMAQSLDRPNGKVHRIRDDGSIPEDNPFAAGRETMPTAYPSIWSYGHRNPQGLVFDLNGHLWDTEHGPRGGDELNRIAPGKNYGWPVVSFGFNYNGRPFATPWPAKEVSVDAPSTDGVAMPVYRWMPSIGACGLDVARGPAFPDWRGDLLAGGLSGQNVDRIRVAPDGNALVEREEILHGLGRVRDVVVGPDGSVYVALNDPDQIIRLAPAER